MVTIIKYKQWVNSTDIRLCSNIGQSSSGATGAALLRMITIMMILVKKNDNGDYDHKCWLHPYHHNEMMKEGWSSHWVEDLTLCQYQLIYPPANSSRVFSMPNLYSTSSSPSSRSSSVSLFSLYWSSTTSLYLKERVQLFLNHSESSFNHVGRNVKSRVSQ